ncbi:MAG: DUF294 nucleotidyltransferase-like domain-containing protein [Fibrobacterales bacterium]
MKITDHANHTEKLFGVRAEDIHKWIDGFFDHDSFQQHIGTGQSFAYNPYDHRKFRHCQEALDEAYTEFSDTYSQHDIKNVFEQHIKDDYNGYIPTRTDFENGTFTQKYHDALHIGEWNTILDSQELSDYFKGVGTFDSYQKPNHFVSTFGFRIVAPTVIAIFLFITAIFLVIVPVFEESMIGQKKLMIKELTASAVSIVEQYKSKSDAGFLTIENAQQRAAQEIQSMRYGTGNKDYFFITDMNPTMIMHPYRKELTGKDLSNYTDTENKSGKKLFVEFVNLVKEHSEGYLKYRWQWMDDAETSVPKLSYVRGVPDWNWVVGTGVYINDIEDEIERLEHTLYQTFFAITLGLILIMTYIITQSRTTENRKRRAEVLLHEAKDRYRALVESSNEGYILEAEGSIIYSNHRLQQMVGYTELELNNHSIWEKLFPNNPINIPVLHHLLALFNHSAEPAEFEAQLYTQSGKTIDIILSTSKIFLSEKQGHVISFRPIIRKTYSNAFTSEKKINDYTGLSSTIVEEIQESNSLGHIVESLNQLPILIRSMIHQGSTPDNLRRVIGAAYDSAIKRFITLSITELGQPPVSFSFISLGSNARHDMTLFSDQDNAIVFDLPDGHDIDKVRRYFLHLADKVCAMLNQAGYPYCEGRIMATNPQWCLSVEEWHNNFSDWITHASPGSILEVNVFFDIRSTYGDQVLVDRIQDHIVAVNKENQQFFIHYAKNCLAYKPPLNLFGKLKTETRDGVKSINLKECLRPMEIFCRIYALKHDIRDANTISRLKHLVACGEIHEESYREMVYIFDHIWNLRFMNQIIEYTDLRKVNDVLAINDLTDLEQQNLRNVLSKISLFQTKISYDFFGGAQI